MGDDADHSAITMLWIVSVLLTIGMLFMCVVALSEHEEVAALFGGAGLGIGGLLATTYQLSRLRRGARTEERIEPIDERLRFLEQEHQRMAELEERLDFAERLLARGEEQPVGDRGARRP